MWLERAREILALKEAGDIAILAGAAVTAFGLSFALPSPKGGEPDAAEQAARHHADNAAVMLIQSFEAQEAAAKAAHR